MVPKSAFIVAGGKLIVLTRAGELAVIQPGDEAPEVLARSQVLGGRSYAEPVLAGGRIFCRNNDGQVVCLDVRPAEADSQAAVRGNN